MLRKGSREKWIASTRFPPCWGRGPTVPSHHSLQVWLPRLSASDWSICALARLSFWNRALLTYRCLPGMGLLALLYPVATAEPPGVKYMWVLQKGRELGLSSGALFHMVWSVSLKDYGKGLRV